MGRFLVVPPYFVFDIPHIGPIGVIEQCFSNFQKSIGSFLKQSFSSNPPKIIEKSGKKYVISNERVEWRVFVTQNCFTTHLKALDVGFPVIVGNWLYDQYLMFYSHFRKLSWKINGLRGD